MGITIKGKKRSIESIDDPTKDELYVKVLKMREPYRSLTAFLYLMGNRISEVVGIPRGLSGRENNTWITKPIRRYDIEYTEDWKMLRAKARTLKRRERPTHTYVCRIDTPEEKRYWRIVYWKLQTTPPEEYVWNINREVAWKRINEATGIPPHKLRGLRATRDAVEFELDAIDLKQKFNWSNPLMAFHYAQKSSHDIEAKLLRKK